MKALFGSLAAALFLVSNVYATAPAAQSSAPADQASASATETKTEKVVEKDVKDANGATSSTKTVEKTDSSKKHKAKKH